MGSLPCRDTGSLLVSWSAGPFWCHRAGAAGRWSSELGLGRGARVSCGRCPVRLSSGAPGAGDLAHNPAPAAMAPPPPPRPAAGPAPVSSPPPGADEWRRRQRRRRPQDPVPSDKRAGGGGSGRSPARLSRLRAVGSRALRHREGEAEAGREEGRRRGRGAEAAARPAAAAALLCGPGRGSRSGRRGELCVPLPPRLMATALGTSGTLRPWRPRRGLFGPRPRPLW